MIMKPQIWPLLSLSCFIFSHPIQAELTALYHFPIPTNTAQTNLTGHDPYGSLMLIGDRLYGTANKGGTAARGAIFSIATNGTGFTNLRSFAVAPDGARPFSELLFTNGKLYGTTEEGGSGNAGTLFSINTNGTGYSRFFNFPPVILDPVRIASTNRDGAFPWGGLIAVGDRLFGTTVSGGLNGSGVIFSIRNDGTQFTNLYNFELVPISSGTNSSGSDPYGTLILAGETLFGTTRSGGVFGNGVVFSISTNGTDFTTLHSFAEDDGGHPLSGLLLIDDFLYGTASFYGNSAGTVFRIRTNGTDFSVLHRFTPLVNSTNLDGAAPYCALIQVGNAVVGTTLNGGLHRNGTIFSVGANGSNFVTLHHFGPYLHNSNTNHDGAYPRSGVLVADSILYGATEAAGNLAGGTLFALPLIDQPTLQLSTDDGTNAVLSWPTLAVGFELTGTADLLSPMWNTIAGASVAGTNFVFTNALSETTEFFRLRR